MNSDVLYHNKTEDQEGNELHSLYFNSSLVVRHHASKEDSWVEQPRIAAMAMIMAMGKRGAGSSTFLTLYLH